MSVNANMAGGIITCHRPQLACVNTATIDANIRLRVTAGTAGNLFVENHGSQRRDDFTRLCK